MAKLEPYAIQVLDKGIHCQGCETRIQSVLARIPGVKEVKASRKTQMVELALDHEVVSVQEVKEKLEDLGYNVA